MGASWLRSALNRALGLARPPPIDAGLLLAERRETAGASEAILESIAEPLSALASALDSEARLSPLGRFIARTRLRQHLSQRIAIARDREELPELSRECIRAPIFITGVPRTGTSILFHTLAQDPRLLSPAQWMLRTPSPPPGARPEDRAKRIAGTARNLRGLDRLLPELGPLFPIGAELPNECAVITADLFQSILFSLGYDVPSYDAWLRASDFRPAYRFHREFLQQLQWKSGRERWVLKSPQHLLSLAALFETYPDAWVIHTHRTPVEEMKSLCNLAAALRSLSCDDLRPSEMGPALLGFWSDALARVSSFRRERPDLRERFVDVAFDDLAADPIGEIRRIYERVGFDLPDPVAEELAAFVRAHARTRIEFPRNSLERLGLDAASVEKELRWHALR
jgi:hypothetical protein